MRSPYPRRLTPGAALLALSALAVVATAFHAPIPQDQSYHLFADTRTYAGFVNFLDVFSNLPFLAAGLYGLTRIGRLRERGARNAYMALCAGVAGVSLGSAYYHLNPTNGTLVWDRLPMTVAFMALFALLLEERVTKVKALAPLIAAGIASVVYWHVFDDLRPYMLVQFLPMVLIPLILFLFPRKYLDGRLLVAALIFYAAAKVFEYYDRQVFARLIFLSGHTVKHLLGGAAALCIIRAVPATGGRET